MNEASEVSKALIDQFRREVYLFQEKISKSPDAFFGDSDNCPLTHSFGDGCYVREIFIPKGCVYVGKIHKFAHPRFLLKGELLVCTESGGTQHMRAPSYMITPAGTKRVGVALEDTVIVTVHVTDKTEMDEIEKEIIAADYDELPEG